MVTSPSKGEVPRRPAFGGSAPGARREAGGLFEGRARRLGWSVLALWTVSSSVALAAVLLVRQAEVRGIYRLVQEAFAQRTLQRLEAARDRLQDVLAAVPGEPGQLADLPEAARALFSHQAADIGTYGALLKVWVTDRQGTVLFASDPADLGKQEPWVAGLSGLAPFTRFHSQAPEDVLYVAVPLVWGDSPVGWLAAHRSTVELRQELASARDEIRRGLLRLLIVFAVVCIALGVTLWYLVGQLSRAEAEASERARLASMGELALAMAHEVRNPLNSISLICQYVLRLLAGDEAPAKVAPVVAEQVGLVRDEVDKLAGVVDNVMRFAWPSELVPQAASVAGICRRAVELQQAELVKNQVEVSLKVPPELTAWVDADQVTRALINLVRNAAEAMPQGGTLQLTAGKEGGWVAIRVRDTGPGVGSQEGFLAPGLRQGRPGPGLGLPIALAIVRAHGGELQADNHPSGGAVFTVLLPADEDSYERRTGAAGRR
jgi:signal transduction histidine kinase